MNPTVVTAANPLELSQTAAAFIADAAIDAIRRRGRFTMTLSGGNSPRATYERLADRTDVDWSRVYLFAGDDRFVEPSNPYSNQALFEHALIGRLPAFPRAHLFPVPVGATNPTEGARQYSAMIARFFQLAAGEWPRFDLALLGLGPDGHTASLFPGSARERGTPPIARMAHAGRSPWVDRVTLTFATFNHARRVLFLAEGAEKAAILKSVLEDEPDERRRPAQGIRPVDGDVTWMLDTAIAGSLCAATRHPDG